MRLSLAVNGQQKARASLTARGWLGAHVNLSNGIESESNDRVWLNAIDTSKEPNTTHSTWGGFPLVPGDKVEIEVLLDGESDAPQEVSETSENVNNLFSDTEQARQLLKSVKSCDTALQEVLERAKDVESEDEFRKLALAVGSVLVELDRQLISPTLRRHPDLLPAAQDMKLR
ncbi:hypothetical protein [Granulicella rosea]|uniref:hypothetical protein n=1 Tax=Granulicella rosea TaxID=474952 RepID=UPI00115DBFEB|nr:hypothetical protein [Granulicella rosea]